MKIYTKLPPTLRTLCWNHDAFIVGGAVNFLIGKTSIEPRDYDAVVPLEEWRKAKMLLINKDVKVNSFGGLKLTENETTIDIWPDDVALVVVNYKINCDILHPKSGKLLICQQI